jgi:hypothetical protein
VKESAERRQKRKDKGEKEGKAVEEGREHTEKENKAKEKKTKKGERRIWEDDLLNVGHIEKLGIYLHSQYINHSYVRRIQIRQNRIKTVVTSKRISFNN